MRNSISDGGWAVVTGASSGLGREFARVLAGRGQPVLAVARRAERLDALAEEVASGDGLLEPLVADLATQGGVEAVATAAGERDVALLINNAGAATYGAFASASPQRQRELIRLNVEAVIALTSALLPALLARGQGGVINIASQMAFQPMPYFASYAASKSFVLSFSEALAAELRDTDVHVTVVAPGFVRTEFTMLAGSESAQRHFPHLDAEDVVRSALRAHDRGRVVKVVGSLYAVLVFAGRFAPRALLRRTMEWAMRPARAGVGDRL